MGWFTTNEESPMAPTPATAATRPREPPKIARAPATMNHGLEWFAKPEILRSGTSRAGVEKPATAR